MLSLSITQALAQATVKSMRETTDFIPAADQRRDFNGQLCALVKVQVVDEITDVEGNVMGNIVNKGVEKWVYMAKDSRNMKIHLKNSLPIVVSFRDYDISGLKSNRVYELALNAPDKQEKGNYLRLRVTPANAIVYIWGKKLQRQSYRPEADGTITTYLPLGRYHYLAQAQGYQDAENDISLTGEDKWETVSLAPIMGTISIYCPTANVDYYLNGQLVKRDKRATQWSGKVVPGRYLVEARLSGHITESETVEVLANQSTTVTMKRLVSLAEQREAEIKEQREREARERKEQQRQVELARAKAEAESLVKMRADSIAREQELQRIKEARIKAQEDEAIAKQRKAEREARLQQLDQKDSQGFTFGLIAGLNIATTQFSSNYSGSTKSQTGFHIGIKGEYLLSPYFGLTAGLLYATKGYKYSLESQNIDETAVAPYVDIPIQGSIRIPLSRGSRLIVNAGPYLSFCTGGTITDEWSKQHTSNKGYEESFSSTYGSSDYGIQAGIAFRIQYHYQIAIDYQLGLANKYKNRNLMIGLGYRF